MKRIFGSQITLCAWAQRKIREYQVINYLEELSQESPELDNNAVSQPLHASLWSVLKEGAE